MRNLKESEREREKRPSTEKGYYYKNKNAYLTRKKYKYNKKAL